MRSNPSGTDGAASEVPGAESKRERLVLAGFSLWRELPGLIADLRALARLVDPPSAASLDRLIEQAVSDTRRP